jgi:hypothetical protein
VAGYINNPRIADIERSIPGIAAAVNEAGLGAEMRSLVEMLDRRDRDIEQRHLNPPSCRVYRTSDLAMVSLANTYIPFDTVRWDSTAGGVWKVGDPTKLYAPAEGVYAVGASVLSSDGLDWGVFAYASAWGAEKNYAADRRYAPGYASVATEISMRAGDYFRVGIYNFEGVNRTSQHFAGQAVTMEAYLTWLRPGTVIN